MLRRGGLPSAALATSAAAALVADRDSTGCGRPSPGSWSARRGAGGEERGRLSPATVRRALDARHGDQARGNQVALTAGPGGRGGGRGGRERPACFPGGERVHAWQKVR